MASWVPDSILLIMLALKLCTVPQNQLFRKSLLTHSVEWVELHVKCEGERKGKVVYNCFHL